MEKNQSFVIPKKYLCPLSLQIMVEPVTASDGHVYEKSEIEDLLRTSPNPLSPLTREPLDKNFPLIINHWVKSDISDFLQTHKAFIAEDDIYLPEAWKEEVIKTVTNKDHVQFEQWLRKDSRLARIETKEQKNVFQLVTENGTVEMIKKLISSLGRETAKKQVMENKLITDNPFYLAWLRNDWEILKAFITLLDLTTEEIASLKLNGKNKKMDCLNESFIKACNEKNLSDISLYMTLGFDIKNSNLIIDPVIFYNLAQHCLSDNSKESQVNAFRYFQLAAERGHAESKFQLGKCYETGCGVEKNSKKALKYYEFAAKQNNAKAQYALGNFYYCGSGKKRNIKKALEYFQLAAKNANEAAQKKIRLIMTYNLAMTYHKAGKYDEALNYLKMVAEQGDPYAQNALGICYDKGFATKKNDEQAFYYFSLAAEQGYDVAQNALGYSYKRGKGVKKDLDKSAYYFELAAKQGNFSAQINIADFYLSGKKDVNKAMQYLHLAADEGNSKIAQWFIANIYYQGNIVKRSLKKALGYFNRAAEQGHTEAQYLLGKLYFDGKDIAKDLKKAFHYLELAAHKGDKRAQYDVSGCYFYGHGVEKSFNKSLLFNEMSANQGFAPALNILGEWYFRGEGVKQDFKKAFNYYKLAADQGYASAQNNLGGCYDEGYGVEKDLKKALYYYKLSAEQQCEMAQKNLQSLLAENPELKNSFQTIHNFFQPNNQSSNNEEKSSSSFQVESEDLEMPDCKMM